MQVQSYEKSKSLPIELVSEILVFYFRKIRILKEVLTKEKTPKIMGLKNKKTEVRLLTNK